MRGRVSSLNAAVAGSILYTRRRPSEAASIRRWSKPGRRRTLNSFRSRAAKPKEPPRPPPRPKPPRSPIQESRLPSSPSRALRQLPTRRRWPRSTSPKPTFPRRLPSPPSGDFALVAQRPAPIPKALPRSTRSSCPADQRRHRSRTSPRPVSSRPPCCRRAAPSRLTRAVPANIIRERPGVLA